MVEYSNKIAGADELGNFSDEGYQFETVYKDPNSMYEDMEKAGVNTDSMTRLDNSNKKMIANNPKLLREKQLKRLFIQYVKKYISNPNKYLQYPKQIKNLPSWFDEALSLFRDVEISRAQKKMLREYFYGLLRYRDDKLAMSDVGGVVNPEETNRQLGERSPYSTNEDDLDVLQLPRQQEAKRFDVDTLMRQNAQMNVRGPVSEEPFAEYGGVNPNEPLRIKYTTTQGKASLGDLGVNAVKPSSLEDYVSIGFRRSAPKAQVALVPTPVAPKPQTHTPSRPGMGEMNLTGFIMGNRYKKPTIVPQQEQPVTEPVMRVTRKPKVRIIRKRKAVLVRQEYQKPQSRPVFDIKKSTETVSKMFDNIRDVTKSQKTKSVGKIDLKINVNKMSKKPIKVAKVAKGKPMSGLETVRNMDRIFGQIRTESQTNFGKTNMKLKLVDNIKDQCNKAFARNKFKHEAMNMKKNYFNDVKASYPSMKSEIKEMGNIRENDMMRAGLRDTTGIIRANRMTSSLGIKRGDMRPEAVGIMDFDFSIDPIKTRGKKKVQLYDEDDFLSRNE